MRRRRFPLFRLCALGAGIAPDAKAFGVDVRTASEVARSQLRAASCAWPTMLTFFV